MIKLIPTWRSWIFLLGLCSFIVITSCEKDDTSTTSEDEENIDPSELEGRFTNFISCSIISPPSGVGLNSYYKKYLNCNGIPVIGNANVPDEAFQIASETADFLLTNLGAIKNQLIRDGNYIILYPEGETLSSVPENFPVSSTSTGAYSWNQNFKALASNVASLLCNPDVGYGHTFVHEMGHMIDIGGLRRLDGGFQNQLGNSYNSAISSGLWNNTYAKTNKEEYFAEAFTIWYGVNWIGPEGGDGDRNEIGDRGMLQAYDSGIYSILNNSVNNLTDMPGCRIPVIPNSVANCPATVTDIDGNTYEVINLGPLCWMKENLKTTRYNDGSAIPEVQDKNEWPNTNFGAWSYYDNNPDNNEVYGKLYNGYAMTSGKLCPQGWHVPTIDELQAAVNYAGGDHEGPNLRTIDYWEPSDFTGTNSSGFSAVPAGLRNSEGFFREYGRRTDFASQTTRNDSIFAKNLGNNYNYVFTTRMVKEWALSCRCVKDR